MGWLNGSGNDQARASVPPPAPAVEPAGESAAQVVPNIRKSITFTRAVKYNAKGRIALIGPGGSGKSYTMLLIARMSKWPFHCTFSVGEGGYWIGIPAMFWTVAPPKVSTPSDIRCLRPRISRSPDSMSAVRNVPWEMPGPSSACVDDRRRGVQQQARCARDPASLRTC